jgi:hypothetical protein
MSRMIALVAALLVWSFLASCSRAQEGTKDCDPFAGPAGHEKTRTVFQAAQAQGLVPQIVGQNDLEAILRAPTRFQFDETPLADAINYLADQHNVDIQLDQKGLTDAAVDSQAPVTKSLRKPIALESGLHLILDDFDLTFVIEDEMLKITSTERADVVLTTKVYPVGDLVTRPRGWMPLMNIITATIQPDSWDDNGGPGTIQPFALGGLLIVSQKRDVHSELRDLLAAMRAELARPKDATDTTPKVVTAVYHLGGASAEQTAEAIKKLVAPTSWQGQRGEGELSAISRNVAQKNGADLLLVRQTEDVQSQIQDLLAEFNVDVQGKRVGGLLRGAIGGGTVVAPAPAEPPTAPAEAAPAASK